MRKIITGAIAALTAAATIGATAAPALAEPHGGWRGGEGWHGGWRGDHDDDRGWGVFGAGLAGFALGATLAHPHYYYGGPYYGGPYYYGPGYYAPYYDSCLVTRRVWDPYWGRWVWRRYYVAC